MRQMLSMLLAVCLACPAATAGGNAIRNGDFEADVRDGGAVEGWACAGDEQRVGQTLTIDKGRRSARSARLTCTRFVAGSPSAHAMLCQMGVAVRRGRVYRLAFWARGKDIAGDVVSVALSDTSNWQNCGLRGAFAPGQRWQRYEFVFRAPRDCSSRSRLQIWYTSTGTLWIDDVELTEAPADHNRPGHVIPADGRRNLVPNASFEAGPAGWGSAEWDSATHWGGRMNRLFGTVEPGAAFHGQHCLRIALTPQTQPVSYFDYFDLHRLPIRAPLAGNLGFIEVQPGKTYVLSAYLRSDQDNTPARLAVRQFQGRSFEQGVRVGRQWQRHAMAFKPTSRWCYVLAGPDLRKTDQTPAPPDSATLWIDAVQLEASARPTDFAPRDSVELGVTTDKCGNVFDWSEPVVLHLAVSNAEAARRDVKVQLELTDFFDRPAWREEVTMTVPAGSAVTRQVTVKSERPLRGFFRLRATLSGREQTLRLARIPRHTAADSRFGVNHAYPWPHLLDLSRHAGLVWVRDWSLKWQHVEPAKGQFTFAETDRQIDRPLKRGHRMLCMLPFPSSPWSSSGATAGKPPHDYVARRAIVARAPRDLNEFENYVERTVRHYRGRVEWFQVFNEPLFTQYALPRKYGYDGATYATYVQAFVRAARRANSNCKILAGMGYLSDGQIMKDFETFFAAGGLRGVDAVDIHHYPQIRPPEFIEPLLEKLNALMDKHARRHRKPIWLTEYGYYADDEPWAIPMPSHGFDQPLASERLQAAYAVRWAAILFANGVEKVFYHAGTCAGINSDSLQGVFYEYAGQPHRIYAAQAVLSHLFPPTCRFVKKLAPGKDLRAYLFRDGRRLVCPVWSTRGAKPPAISIRSKKLILWDLMGRPLQIHQLTPSSTPVYVLADDLTVNDFESALE